MTICCLFIVAMSNHVLVRLNVKNSENIASEQAEQAEQAGQIQPVLQPNVGEV
jgi:hypothetical protein